MRNYLVFENDVASHNNVNTIFCDDIASIIETLKGLVLITKQNLIFSVTESPDDNNCEFLIGAGGELVHALCSFVSRGYSKNLETSIIDLLNDYADEHPDEEIGDIFVNEQCMCFDMSHITVTILPLSELETLVN